MGILDRSTGKWCVVDAEGEAGTDKLQGVAFYSDRLQAYLTDHAAIRSELENHAHGGYTFVAHNAQYDLPVIFWTLELPMRAVYYDSAFNRGQWKYSATKPMAELWDSFNLSGNLALWQLGDAIGLPKLETPQILTGRDPDRYKWRCELHRVGECIECYAVRDAEIVYRYMVELEATVSALGVRMGARIAGTAQHVWRALDAPQPIAIGDPRIKRLARSSFFGGRVETFKLGHMGPLYTADVASMYPSIMRDAGFPDPDNMVYVKATRPADLPLHLEGVAEVTVFVAQSYVPALPNSQAGRRVFGTGLQRGVWTFPELRHAVAQGTQLAAVHQAAWSTITLSPFRSFINALWEMRQEYKRTGDPRAQTIKVLLNSSYGRLGLRGDLAQEIIEPWNPTMSIADYLERAKRSRGKPRKRPDGLWESELPVYPMVVDGQPFVKYGRPIPYEQTWVNVLWASLITANARVKLHTHLVAQGSSLVYCDTDSVFSLAPIQGLGEGLGALCDPLEYTSAWIVGPKLYALERIDGTQVVKAKGVNKSRAQAFLRGEEVYFDSPVSMRTQRDGGPRAGTWVQISRSRQLVPHRRTPTNPSALLRDQGWSDTVPPSY